MGGRRHNKEGEKVIDLTKKKAFRSRLYLSNIKTQDCKWCFAPADEPHHIKGIGNLSGAGMTAPDSAAMAMCRGCHTEMHSTPGNWPSQWDYILMTQLEEIRSGRLRFCAGAKSDDVEKLVRAIMAAMDNDVLCVRG